MYLNREHCRLLAGESSIYNIAHFMEKDIETIINLHKILKPPVVGVIIPHKGKLMMVKYQRKTWRAWILVPWSNHWA